MNDRSGTTIEFTCNGSPRAVNVPAERLLVHLLRDDLELTGTKLGCGTGDCGACTVLLDGQAVTSCLIYAAEVVGRRVETIEQISTSPTGSAVVDAFVEQGAVQCGICTPGLVVAAAALIQGSGGPLSEELIKDELAGNLCRCTGYFPIIRAVQSAAAVTTAHTSQARE